MTKVALEVFVCWAHLDALLADKLLAELKPQLMASRRYAFHVWRDRGLVIGEHWRQEIARALRQCWGGLILVSPALLSSDFIDKHELPHFLAGVAPKPALPVMLQRVSFERHDLKGLEDVQIFTLDGRAYGDLTTKAQRSRFAEQFFLQIETRCDRMLAGAP